jgi:hypothetical protein
MHASIRLMTKNPAKERDFISLQHLRELYAAFLIFPDFIQFVHTCMLFTAPF